MTPWAIRTAKLAPQGNAFAFGKNPFIWGQFDALPAIVRQVLNYAPLEFGTQRATDNLRRAPSVEAVARQEMKLARRFMGELTLETYGPDHPQAPNPSCDP